MSATPHPAELMQWGMTPRATLGREDCLSAAWWRWSGHTPIDVTAPALAKTHIVSVCLAGRSRAEMFKDGRHWKTSTLSATTTQIMTAGIVPRAVLSGPGQLLHLYLPELVLAKTREDPGLSQTAEIIDPGHEPETIMGKLAEQVLQEAQSPDAASNLLMDSIGMQLCVHLLRHWSSNAIGTRTTSRGARGLMPWQMRRVTEFMLEHLSRNIQLAVLARQAGLSPYHFARAFKAETGVPPHRFFVQLKLARARELLGSSNSSVTEIAAALGYDDVGYLARLFRRHHGVTPIDYRRECQS